MSNFYIEYPDQQVNLNYVHPYFKEYATNGSETIYAHNINYGFSEKIESFVPSQDFISYVEYCLSQNIKQGELVITINNKTYYGWWAIVK